MFDIEVSAGIKAIRVKAKEKNGVVARICTMIIDREFDDEIATALGADARQALQSLRGGGLSSCVLPTEALEVNARLVSDHDQVDIPALKGVQARGDAGAEDMPPSICLEFEFPFSEPAWVFLGKHCGAVARVTFRSRQLTLVGTQRRGHA
jgi:hypothetical protein